MYGLGANALDPAAVAAIFAAKGRPAWDPLIVHVPGRPAVDGIATVSPEAERLMAAFWPGPLTLLLPRTAAIPDAVTAGRALVGVRVPAHPLALELLRQAALPIAAPSANRFGHTSPTTAEHVLLDLDGRIDAVLDGGPTRVGVESTVLDPTAGIVYRPGAVTPDQIAAVLGRDVTLYQPGAETEVAPASLPSPGVGIRHYAPRARLILVEGTPEALVRAAAGGGGAMLPDGWSPGDASASYPWGAWDDPEGLARRLFAGLRALDEAGVEVILCPLPDGDGIGAAMLDRLRKAAR